MIEKVLPAIKAKWPRDDLNKPIYIQQDNAPSHIEVNDPLFCQAAQQDGFDIRLTCQPANSPDFNILDLGFLRAIQSIQYKKIAKTIQDLIPVVQEVCDDSIIQRFIYSFASCTNIVLISCRHSTNILHIRQTECI
jgi:hypothetical protein